VRTLEEIKAAIAQLSPQEKAMLVAELFATETSTEDEELERALTRGLEDANAGRVRPIEDVRDMIPQWISEVRSDE